MMKGKFHLVADNAGYVIENMSESAVLAMHVRYEMLGTFREI